MKHQISHTEISTQQVERVEEEAVEFGDLLDEYITQLLWWNKKINLVSKGVSRETLTEHVKHSLLISQSELFEQAKAIVDTGTGGGLPGIPLSICYPEKNFLLNDIVGKKILAVKQIVSRLKIPNVNTAIGSIAALEIKQADLLVTKHAFKVHELFGLIKNSGFKRVVFLKGEQEAMEEISKVVSPLKVGIITLDTFLKSPFYEGKAIISIEKLNE